MSVKNPQNLKKMIRKYSNLKCQSCNSQKRWLFLEIFNSYEVE